MASLPSPPSPSHAHDGGHPGGSVDGGAKVDSDAPAIEDPSSEGDIAVTAAGSGAVHTEGTSGHDDEGVDGVNGADGVDGVDGVGGDDLGYVSDVTDAASDDDSGGRDDAGVDGTNNVVGRGHDDVATDAPPATSPDSRPRPPATVSVAGKPSVPIATGVVADVPVSPPPATPARRPGVGSAVSSPHTPGSPAGAATALPPLQQVASPAPASRVGTSAHNGRHQAPHPGFPSPDRGDAKADSNDGSVARNSDGSMTWVDSLLPGVRGCGLLGGACVANVHDLTLMFGGRCTHVCVCVCARGCDRRCLARCSTPVSRCRCRRTRT